eukprot:SAG11_NODE_1338_length_5170_cov_4.262473_2_plen_748_part_00
MQQLLITVTALLSTVAAVIPAGQGKTTRVSSGTDELHAVLAARREEPPHLRAAHIVLAPGTHRLTKPLTLTAGDGPLSFAGEGNASIDGGILVSGWKKSATAGRWHAPIPDGFNASGIGSRMQMWRGDTRLTLARSPTLTYVHAGNTNITFKGSDIKPTYHDMESVFLVLYESWTASMHMLGHVDAASHTAFLASNYNSQWANSAAGSRYYVQNAIEELDSEGEFYIDRISGTVHLKSTTDPSADEIVVAGPVELLVLAGTVAAPLSDVSYTNVEFKHTSVESTVTQGFGGQSGDFMTTAAVHITFAVGVVFDSCSFRATGGYAFWAEQGAHRCQLTRSTLTDLGSGAVRLGRGHAVDAIGKPESEGHLVADNVMSDGGHVCQEGCGILAQNIGNTTLTHNEIGHFRYTGISTGWTWGYGHTVVHDIITSFNHIHHIGEGFLSDMGCVYTLGHQPGSKIVNNFCSDVQSYNYGGWAYYTDEGSRDELFESNVALRTKCAGHHQHYGTDNRLLNNVYYHVNIGDVATPGRAAILMPDHCDGSIRASTHRRDPSSCSPDTAPHAGCCCYPGCDQGKCSSFHFERNIVYQPATASNLSSFVDTTFAEGLDNFTFTKNLYWSGSAANSGRPLFNDTGGGHRETFAAWQAHGKDVSSIVADPEFVAEVGAAGPTSFALKPISPAITKLGFQPIDISDIGPRPAAGRGEAEVGSGRGRVVRPAGVAGLEGGPTEDVHLSEMLGLGMLTHSGQR